MRKDLFGTLAEVVDDLRDLRASWALVGGIAFQVLVEPRFTRDIDLAIAVANDREAESVARDLLARGYRFHPNPQVEHEAADRLSTLRFIPPGGDPGGVIVDLLFASSGIEREIVATSIHLEVIQGLSIPVITKELLLAVKVLAGWPQDLQDATALVRLLGPDGILRTREALDLIDRRGFHRHKDLQGDLNRLLGQVA